MQSLLYLKNKLILIIGIGILCAYPYISNAQFDSVWALNASTLDFRFTPPLSIFHNDSIYHTWPLGGHTNICDSNGILQFTSNGKWLGTNIFDTMKNGELFSPIPYINQNDRIPQGSLILPLSLNNKYLVIYGATDSIRLSFSSLLFDDVDYQPTYLLYSIVDMSEDNGNGAVIEKNRLILNDTLANGRFTVCRHANGKDWWLLANEFMTNCYYTILIHPDGTFEPAFKQCIGSVQSYLDQIGQACFSPDGKYYCNAVYNDSGIIDLFRFDRCLGILSNYNAIRYAKTAYRLAEACAFSSNSRFLYLSVNDKLYQYDLHDTNTDSNLILLDNIVNDTMIGSYLFRIAQLAPNNKIYIGTGYPFSSMHVINNPDEKGMNCMYERFGQPLLWSSNLPNVFPYYYLYGSAIYVVDAGADKTICPGDSVQLGIKSVKDALYEWSGDIVAMNDIYLAQPIVKPSKVYSTYYLHITDTSDAVSCKERWDTVHVTMIETCIDSVPLFIQNPQSAYEQAFFTIQNLPPNTGLKLYNMLGELVYTTENYQNDFPLAKLSRGYYIYELKLSEENIFKKYYYKGKVLVY